MKKALIVAKWEFYEKVFTKTFLISLILTPAIIITFALLPTMLSNQEDNSIKTIGIIDTSGNYFKPMKNSLEKYKLNNGQPNYLLINLVGSKKNLSEIKKESDEEILSGKLEGYLLIINGGTDSVTAEYRSKNAGNFKDLNKFEEVFNLARIKTNLEKEGVNNSFMKYIENKVELKPIKIERNGEGRKSDFLVLFFTSFIFIILLMMMILSSGGMLIRSLVEEKSNRLIEILVSSCTPNELLAGKVLGLSSLGLAQVLIWTLIGIALAGTSLVPLYVFNNILPIFGYFAMGFIFYTSIFVGIGSIVTTEQEAQQITSYLSLIIMLPIVVAIPAIQNPDSLMVHIFSYIPFTIPAIMILRLNIGPIPLWEIFSSTVIMIGSIHLSISISGKIFKIGILSYGKRPSLKELINWIKEK